MHDKWVILRSSWMICTSAIHALSADYFFSACYCLLHVSTSYSLLFIISKIPIGIYTRNLVFIVSFIAAYRSWFGKSQSVLLFVFDEVGYLYERRYIFNAFVGIWLIAGISIVRPVQVYVPKLNKYRGLKKKIWVMVGLSLVLTCITETLGTVPLVAGLESPRRNW